MGQLKRLTRRQKIVLHRLYKEFDYAQRADPADLDSLEKHGLITLDNGKWSVTPKGIEKMENYDG